MANPLPFTLCTVFGRIEGTQNNLSTFVMTSPRSFIVETVDELKKVVWPTRNEVIRLTSVVIISSLIVGLYIGGLDFALTNLVGYIIK